MKFISAILLVFLVGIAAVLTRADPGSSFIHQVTETTHNPDTYDVSVFTIPRTRTSTLPVELLVFVPRVNGSYRIPVTVFLHGFMLSGDSYRQLLSKISARGFIVVAPQLRNSFLDNSAVRNIREAAKVLEWLPNNWPSQLADVSPDFDKLVIMGHSKGGKAAFALALKKESNVTLPFSALVAMDPVDGSGSQMEPKILTFKGADQLHLPFPTLIVGTYLGSQGWKPCAPKKFGHKNFFKETAAPAFHFVPMDYGHMDFLNDRLSFSDRMMLRACARARTRQPMREFTGKLVADFLDGVLFKKTNAFNAALKYPSAASITIADPQSKGRI